MALDFQKLSKDDREEIRAHMGQEHASKKNRQKIPCFDKNSKSIQKLNLSFANVEAKKKELAQETESAFDTYTYGFSKSSGINYVRKTMFQDHKFDEETLSKIADMMDAENDGELKKSAFLTV